jgi:hypothetical protein
MAGWSVVAAGGFDSSLGATGAGWASRRQTANVAEVSARSGSSPSSGIALALFETVGGSLASRQARSETET